MKTLKSSVHKTFALLEYFTPQKTEWGVTELAAAIGSNKSTVYRFLSDMQKLGILYKNSSNEKYRLGLKLFELGNRVELKSAFIDKTHPALVEVAKNITETVHIGILKNEQVFYVDKVESPQGLKLSSHIGSYNPASATALGKILLAYLPKTKQLQTIDNLFVSPIPFTKNTIIDKQLFQQELDHIRQKSYAIDREELEIGLICVAIPIFNQKREIVAALSASGPANRFKEEEVINYVATLQKGAVAIQNTIGFFKL